MAQINAKAKGSRYELQVRDIFRALGYIEAETSRNKDRTLDAAGVDLADTGPWLVQCKAVERLGNVHTILDNMPKSPHTYRVLWHKRNRQGSVVVMDSADFLRLAALAITQEPCPLCNAGE